MAELYNKPRIIQLEKPEATSKAELARKGALASRLVMTTFGGVTLMTPTIIMAKVNRLNVSLGVTSAFVFVFGIIMAFGAKDGTGKDVLAATAAYAAVLVVFIGTTLE